MRISLDVTYMYTNFGGRYFSGFGDIATLKNGQFSLSTHGHGHAHVHGHQKIQLLRIGKQVGVDVTYMYTNVGGRDLSGLEILLLSKTANFPF